MIKRRSLQATPAAVLTHFTRAVRTSSAMDNLVSILDGQVIRGVAGWSAAACLPSACLIFP